jgi:hypothetical protein
MLGACAFFSGAYLLLYLAVNLSYRQRDALFPLLIVLAVIAWDRVRQWRPWRWWYGAYWVALGLLATAHLAARARLG